jgi:AcrR family transcriptional regulator
MPDSANPKTNPAGTDLATADGKRERIVRLAAELFDQHGFHGTNVGEIALAAGIRKPTLYHYFSSKEEILYGIHAEAITILIEKQEMRSHDLPAEEALFEMMSDLIGLMDTHRGHIRVVSEHYRELGSENRATILRERARYQSMVEDVIRRGISRRELRQVDPRLVTLALFGMCNWAYQWYSPGGSMSSRQIAAVFCDLLVNGLRP